METGLDIVRRIETHCGEQIKTRRLRLLITSAIQRELDEQTRLKTGIEAILAGSEPFNPRTHKAIRRSQ